MERKYIIFGTIGIFLLLGITIGIIVILKKKKNSNDNTDGGGGNGGDGGGGNNNNSVCSPLNWTGTCDSGRVCYKGTCLSTIPSGKFTIFKSVPNLISTLSFINYDNVNPNPYKKYYFPLGLVDINKKNTSGSSILQIPGTFTVSATNDSGVFTSLDVYYEYESETKYIRVYSGTMLNTHSASTKWYLKTDLTGNNNQGVVYVVSEDKSPSTYNIISSGDNIIIQDVNSSKYFTQLAQSDNTVYMIGLSLNADSAVLLSTQTVQDILSTTGNNGMDPCVTYCSVDTNGEMKNIGWKTATCGGTVDNVSHVLYDCNYSNNGAEYLNCSCIKQT